MLLVLGGLKNRPGGGGRAGGGGGKGGGGDGRAGEGYSTETTRRNKVTEKRDSPLDEKTVRRQFKDSGNGEKLVQSAS